MYYATLTQVRAYLKLDTAETGDDALLTDFIRSSSRYCDTRSGTHFYPLIETRYFDVPENRRMLQFDDHLLELTSATNGDATAITLSDLLYHPATIYPKYGTSLKAQSSQVWTSDTYGECEQVIALTGVWGYHDDYSRAWVLSGDAVADALGLNASVTTINVTNASGAANDLIGPRFQAGQLIKVDSEYIDITSITGNALTVVRGVYGSTAAAHLTAAPISVYRTMADVTMAVIRLTAWRYRQKDANVFDATTIIGTGVKTTPSATPPDVDGLIPMPIHLVYRQ
ncbi:MAG: phage gp6-like head-tail connector protein [Xanthomonadales bacterium]|nr:phage gp6-like head-tail connector protein [Xanthomonadales bacterium]